MATVLDRSISLYYSELAKTRPAIGAQAERRLIRRRREQRDTRARDALVRCHLRFVVSMARRHSREADALPDLIGSGNIGLLTALDRFDPTRTPPTRFLTYAGWWMQMRSPSRTTACRQSSTWAVSTPDDVY